jgi:putative ABC transport system ATP-binding protein
MMDVKDLVKADIDTVFKKSGSLKKIRMENDSGFLLDIKGVCKSYPAPGGEFEVLKDINLRVGFGEFIAIVGKSGSGKSTLLNLIAGIDRPSSGEIFFHGRPVHSLDENQSAAWRGLSVGIVFQFFQLLPTMTILENVLLPMDFCRSYPLKERKPRAFRLLEYLDIADQADKLPAALSGGQQQRAAIARALANDPPLVVADEPTGNLDSHTSETILDLFAGLVKAGKTLVMVTHERDIAKHNTIILTLSDGRIIEGSAHA